MKKLLLLFLILLIPLTSCFKQNETFEHNKRVLDENYEVNANYAVITGRTYQTADETIDFGNLIDKQIRKDHNHNHGNRTATESCNTADQCSSIFIDKTCNGSKHGRSEKIHQEAPKSGATNGYHLDK